MRPGLSRLGWFALGFVAALVLLETILHFLPVSTGMRRTEDSGRWPLQDTPPRSAYSYSITWAMLNAHRGVTNNYGHVAPFDYQKDSEPIVVIGDSFVESLMNDYAETVQGQLGRLIGRPERVYGLGVSGLSASDYVALSRQAKDEFKPVAAVYVIADGDLSESLLQRQGTYFLVPRGGALALDYSPSQRHRGEGLASDLRQAVADSSIHRYFQVNLQFSVDKVLSAFEPGRDEDSWAHAAPPSLEDQRRVADWFLAELPTSLALPPKCVVLLVDTDRYAIYRPDLASPRKDLPAAREYLIRQAQGLGFTVSDLDPEFRRRFAGDHGRFDHFPIDRHWNSLGHRVAAEEAYRLLFQRSTGNQSPCLSASFRGGS
jgi:hypothetical protein